MQFVVTKEHLYWWPIKVSMPSADDAGEVQSFEFQMRFRALARSRVAEIDAEAAQNPGIDIIGQTVREVSVGWDQNVVDEHRAPVPFSKETLAEAMENGWFTKAVWNAYVASIKDDPKKGN